jgi:hypothetical protein
MPDYLQGGIDSYNAPGDATDAYGIAYTLFDPGAVLAATFPSNPEVAALYCSTCQQTAGQNPVYLQTSSLAGYAPEYGCYNQYIGDASAICAYLYGFALSQFASDFNGVANPPCADYSGSGDPEMPPDVVSVYTKVPGGCGGVSVPISPSDLIAVLDEASPEEIADIQSALGIIPLTCEAITAAISIADNGDQFNQGVVQGVAQYATGPDGLPALLTLFSAIFFPEGLAAEETGTFITWFKNVAWPWIEKYVQLDIICDDSQPPGLGFGVNVLPPAFVITFNLSGFIDCGGQGTNINTEAIQWNDCSNEEEEPYQLAVPVLIDADGNDQGKYFQLLLDKLTTLEKCCNPCTSSNSSHAYAGLQDTGVQDISSTFPGLPYSMRIDVTASQAQGAANFSNPPRWKYGTLSIGDSDGDVTGPFFVNYTGQIFYFNQQVTSPVTVSYHFEPGVVATLTVVYVEHPPFPVVNDSG